MLNIITIQDQLTETVNNAMARWSYRPRNAWGFPGQSGRTIYAAQRKARLALAKCGMNPAQVSQAIRDAMDMAELIRHSQDGDE